VNNSTIVTIHIIIHIHIVPLTLACTKLNVHVLILAVDIIYIYTIYSAIENREE